MSVGVDYTTTGLITNAARRAQTPNSQSLFLPADFVALMNDEMHSFVTPLIKSKNDEYFVTKYDAPLVASTSTYKIPTRAQGGALRDVVLVDSTGQEYDLPRLEPEFVKNSVISNAGLTGIYLQDDNVVLFPAMPATPPTGFSLRFKYERMPNDLVVTGSAGLISAINAGTSQITLASIPSGWTTSTTLDVILPVPLFTSVADDVVISGVASTTLTLATWPTSIAVGQWVAESRTSPIPQVPYEAHKLIAQRGAIKLYEAMGDTNGLKAAVAAYSDMVETLEITVAPRVKGSPKKIVNRKGIMNAQRGVGTRPW
jgi:hypothetical protein